MNTASPPELLALALEAEQKAQALARAEARLLSLTAENLHFRDRLGALTQQLSAHSSAHTAAQDASAAAASDASDRATSLLAENDTLRSLVKSLIKD